MDSTTSYTSFDEKRDYEERRNRKRSSSTSSARSFCSEKSGYSSGSDDSPNPPSYTSLYQDNNTSSDKPLPPLPSTSRHVRFVLSKPLPPLPTSEDGGSRKRARSSSEGDYAWWAQRRFQITSEREEEFSEKETYEDDVRHRWVKIQG